MMRIKIWCGKCGESYDMQNLMEKKGGFSFDLFHADTIIAKSLHCERIGQHLQGYFGKEENIEIDCRKCEFYSGHTDLCVKCVNSGYSKYKPKEKLPEPISLGEYHANWLAKLEEGQATTEKYLEKLARDLEPQTHCCECTPGDHYQKHLVHIQYPKCNCDPKKYMLKVND